MNVYDVLGKLHIKATATVEQSVAKDLEKKDPPVDKALNILEVEIDDEDSEGDDGAGSDGDDRESS